MILDYFSQSLDRPKGLRLMGQRLLIVDDEPQICDYIKAVAEPMGFDVEVTSGGEDFLEAYDRETPTLICLDMVMPKVDGLQLLNELIARDCKSPVLIISGYNRLFMDSTKNLGDAYGSPYIKSLEKPIRIETLENGLREAVQFAQ